MTGKLWALCCTPCCDDEFIQLFLKCHRWLQMKTQNEVDSFTRDRLKGRGGIPLILLFPLFSNPLSRCFWGKYQPNRMMWSKTPVDEELFKKSSAVMSQSSLMNKAMGWRQEGEAGSLAHKTCCYLDLGLKTSGGVWSSKGTDHISAVASQEDQQ